MCIAFYTLSQPGYKLILASNRDEFLARPTEPAKWHNFSASPNANGKVDRDENEGWVLSGIDAGATNGGTWLGITKDLRIGLLTNNRLTPPIPPFKPSLNPPSRGLLLKEFLSPKPENAPQVHQYLKSHYKSSNEYEGFNLLLFSLRNPNPEIGYLTNRPEPHLSNLHIPLTINNHDDFSIKCFGISNSPMNKPWPKVENGQKQMEKNLKQWKLNNENEKQLINRMFDILSPNIPIKTENDSKLSIQIPLINLSSHLTNSPIDNKINKINEENPTVSIDTNTNTNVLEEDKLKMKSKWYGTRTSTIILIKDNGETIFVERDILILDQNGNPKKGNDERWFNFKGDIII
ncbi:uncharacterized protein I206_102269 [Kwoniella pini CBS 10737]|uniref:Ser/Thr-rich protein T10 in DGCR region n=1 Tax=Kwoniella pini CBS 10737 TaxID=1296096 RepID=A0A1B9HT15_9TREE|nr:uncharacterized protein I206_07639 [Kwoniella pini CBS 10737]OCF46405.1 hypothetical protein I206_07639 [Kwoniella pini CBS 10737]